MRKRKRYAGGETNGGGNRRYMERCRTRGRGRHPRRRRAGMRRSGMSGENPVPIRQAQQAAAIRRPSREKRGKRACAAKRNGVIYPSPYGARSDEQRKREERSI